MNQSILADIFPILDMAVMERTDDGSFRLIGPIPDSLRNFCHEITRGEKTCRPEQGYPFLKNFLTDAEAHWEAKRTGKRTSGPWMEIDAAGEEHAYEATAISLEKRKILLIEPARASYREKQFLIQKGRELRLAYHRLERLADIFPLLDMAVMERMDKGAFRVVGMIPPCLKAFFPEPVADGERFRPEEGSPFLENFLFEAEDYWESEDRGRLKSGPWTETDSQGNEFELEATAISLEKRKILLIEPARYPYEEKQTFMQKSRELSLAYHRLAQTEAALQRSKEVAEDANKKIMSSIHYAKTIQRSLLPNMDEVKKRLPHSFFLWMPRDIVGGDIFFTRFFEDGFILTLADCTGHGVPGAFMTMITSSALQQIVKDEGCRNPAEILNRLNFNVKTLLRQDTSHAQSDDGLDAAIVDVRSSDGSTTLTFAGARLPLIRVRNGEASMIKGDRQSIGYKRSDLGFDFTNHTLRVEKGTSFYMATDGFWDQLCLDKCRCSGRRTFGKRRFVELLRGNAHLPFEAQRDTLIQKFSTLKGDNERQDDITVVGFSLNPSI